MLVLRLVFALLALLLIMNGGMYIFTRDRRYLDLAWKVLRFAVLLALVFGLLFILERYVLVGWKILL